MNWKKIKHVIALTVMCVLTSCSSIKTNKVFAETKVNESLLYNTIEHDIYNTGSVGAITNNVDAIRFLSTKKVGVDENHLDLYFGLKEKLDLSDVNTTLDLQVRALEYFSGKTDYDTKIKVYIIDEKGAVSAARYNKADVIYQDGTKGNVDCSNNGYAFQGFSCVADNHNKYLSQSIRTYCLTKNNFQLYSTYNTSATEFDYSNINKVIVETWTPKDGGTSYQYEVMNISSTKNDVNTNLFSASTATMGEDRNVKANEWYFDSIPTADPYTLEEKKSLPLIVEQVKARDGGITLFNDSGADTSFWLRSYNQLDDGQSDIANFTISADYSKYDHIAFYVDTTECETDVNVEIKVYWADSNVDVADANRYFRAGSSSFLYVPEEGEPYYGRIPSGSYIEKGFKGYVYLDLSTFLQDGVGGSYLTYDRLQKLAQNIRFIFNAKKDYKLSNGLEGVAKLKIKDIKFVDSVYSNLEIEKVFTKINLDFNEGTTVDEILETLPSAISIGADIKTNKTTGSHSSSSVVENQFIQLEGSWVAGEIDSNGFVELKFTPDKDSSVKLHNEYSFENDVTFTFYGYIKRTINRPSSENSSIVSSENIPSENVSSETNSINSENVLSSIVSSTISSSINSPSEPPTNNKLNEEKLLKIGIAIASVAVLGEIIAIILVSIRRKK